MPRPADHYTHAQFEPIESDYQGETVQCMHCRHWTGSLKTLSRKKQHLINCHAYAAWREAGNGQDLPPPNKYAKRDSAAMHDADPYASPYAENTTPATARQRGIDLSKLFDEFFDDSIGQKCMRARCNYCGFVRAKNSTRQFEHIQQCPDFLNSADGQQALEAGIISSQDMPDGQSAPSTWKATWKGDIWKGGAPNPNLNFKGLKSRQSSGRVVSTPSRPGGPGKAAPSLINHLLAKNHILLEQATQLQFLSHAGCGTLSRTALEQWLTQQSHTSRALCTFIGSLIGKIRLSETLNPSGDTSWRALDLLVSAVNNAKRELEFLRTTHLKYGLRHDLDPPKPATKGFIDLFAGCSSPSASLLEGLVVFWAVEHLHCLSWKYAANFIQAVPPSSTSYTMPSYLQPGQYDMPNPYGQPPTSNGPDTSHTSALHEALIPNWTSVGFTKFAEACRAIVDELTNAQTTGNGAVELNNCETNFKQVIWLWKQVFPEVTGMGDESDGNADAAGPSHATENGNRANGPIEIADEDGDDDDDSDVGGDHDGPVVDSPYGGLSAVAAANRAA